MLRGLLRLLRDSRQEPSLINTDSNHVVLYAHIEEPPAPTRQAAALPAKTAAAMPLRASHRQRLYAMKMEHTKLCSPRRCERLRELGIVTAGDFSVTRPEQLARRFGSPGRALRVIKRYRRAIRFAASVPGMMPRDALLLISIHRRSVGVLAGESPAALHRDLERFAESTTGRRQLRGRRIPSTRRLRRWISECKSCSIGTPLHARAA